MIGEELVHIKEILHTAVTLVAVNHGVKLFSNQRFQRIGIEFYSWNIGKQ